MDFTQPPRYAEEVKAVMVLLVPDYLERLSAKHLSAFITVCTQMHNLHWQMVSVDNAQAAKNKQDRAIVDGSQDVLDFPRKKFLPNDELPF